MTLRSARLGDSGAVAIWMAVSIAALIGIIALSLDLGRTATTHTELKWAADAAALSGAKQLEGTLGARDRARLAATGTLTGSGVGLTANADTFDEDADAIEVVNVKFLSILGPGEGPAGDVEATSDENARFIEVTVEHATVNNLLIQVVGGPATSTVQQSSVAGLGAAICQAQPLFFCNPQETGGAGTGNKEVNLAPGVGVLIKDGGGNSAYWGPGNYGLLEVPGFPGADAVRTAFALNGAQTCFERDLVTTKPGNPVSVNAGLNIRLDMYKSPLKPNDPLPAPAKNVIKGLSYLDPKDKCEPSTTDFQTYSGEGDPTVDIMAYPRDRCFYTAACDRYGNGEVIDGVVADWDRARYCEVNHPGGTCPDLVVNDPKETKTRYGLYRAEIEQGKIPDPAKETAKTVCYKTYPWSDIPNGADVRELDYEPSTSADRRVVTAAVINCEEQKELGNLNGHKTVEVAKWLLMFMPEAAGEYGDNQQIFLEVIRQIDLDQDDAIAREIVQLYR